MNYLAFHPLYHKRLIKNYQAISEKGAALTEEERCRIIDQLVITASPENKLNLLIYDGDLIYAHCNYRGSLHQRFTEDGVCFSTKPLSLGKWQEVPFIQLLLIWLASKKDHVFTRKAQAQAVQNFKNAAHYDLKTVKIAMAEHNATSVADAGIVVIEAMKIFFQDYGMELAEILEFEEQKLIDPDKRYAWQVRKLYGEDFAKKGLQLAKERSEQMADK